MRLSMMFLCMLLIVGVIASCSRVSPDEVPGTYAMHSPYGIELLRLGTDGRYIQVVLLNTDSTAITHSGSWWFSNDSTSVCLWDALMVVGLDGKLRNDVAAPVKGSVSAGIISRYGSTVWLRGDENYAWEIYKKIECNFDPVGG